MIKGVQFRPANEEGFTIDGEKDEWIKVDQSSSGKEEDLIKMINSYSLPDNHSQHDKMIKPKNIKRFIQSRPEFLEYHIHMFDVPQQNMR